MSEGNSKLIPAEVGEVWQMIVAYAKQETLEEIKPLGRFLGFGLAGSLFLSIGLISLMLAGLRALQTETGSTFTGNLSWLPYLITLAGAAIAAVFAASRISARKKGQ
jgi:hypothetical protein